MIDNYHLVDMQIREIGVDLPRGYYAQLPILADGPFAGLPRLFGAMWSVVAHADSHSESETQPRVTPSLPVGRHSSLFQRVFSSMDGTIRMQRRFGCVSGIFGEGSYAGKGIYDIDTFEVELAGRVPDPRMLSHDLFEGIFARAGLASDIEVVEEFPAAYVVAAVRQHRWARGDWQLLPWIVSRRVMPAIGRWKMLDNLRRTLSSPAAVLALLLGWQLPFHAAGAWTAFVLLSIALSTLLPVLGDIVPPRQWITWRSYFSVLATGLRHAQLPPDQPIIMADDGASPTVTVTLGKPDPARTLPCLS